jgi:hypothetical protein
MNPTTPNQTSSDPTETVINAILDVLVQKNPMFAQQRDAYRAKITEQFETYLITNLITLLTQTDQEEFQVLLMDEPENKELHDQYLAANVPDFDRKVVDLCGQFVQAYVQMIDSM